MSTNKLVIEQFLLELVNDLHYKDNYTFVINKNKNNEYDLGAFPSIDLLNLTNKDKKALFKSLQKIDITLVDFKICCKIDFNNNDLLIFPYIYFYNNYIFKIHYEYCYNIILSFIRQIDFILSKYCLL